MTQYALNLRDLSFAYEGFPPSIRHLDLSIRPGECHVLMGASGSGKTTIIRTVNGLAGGYYTGTISGELHINARAASSLSSWQRAGIVGSVFQDPASQFFSPQLAGEVAFGCENLGLKQQDVRHRTDAMIFHMKLDHLRDSSIDMLSSGEKQKVAIASALAPSPKILAMDEPSANLDTQAARELGKTLSQLKKDGYTLLIAEHRISYLMDTADYFHYVSGGEILRTLTRSDIENLNPELRTEMGIRSPVHIPTPDATVLNAPPAYTTDNAVCLEAENLTVRRNKREIVSQADLRLASGTITAVTGENGVGKTTFMRAIAGLTKQQNGTVRLNGLALSMGMRRKKIWYSPNDLSAQFFTASVAEEIMLQVEKQPDTIERARTLLQELGLYGHKNHHPYALSGGQKQRLALACALMQKRPVLIFDEPTSGLDAINMERLACALKTAAQEGAAIAVVTHDNEFIERCATHIYRQESPRFARQERKTHDLQS